MVLRRRNISRTRRGQHVWPLPTRNNPGEGRRPDFAVVVDGGDMRVRTLPFPDHAIRALAPGPSICGDRNSLHSWPDWQVQGSVMTVLQPISVTREEDTPTEV